MTLRVTVGGAFCSLPDTGRYITSFFVSFWKHWNHASPVLNKMHRFDYISGLPPGSPQPALIIPAGHMTSVQEVNPTVRRIRAPTRLQDLAIRIMDELRQVSHRHNFVQLSPQNVLWSVKVSFINSPKGSKQFLRIGSADRLKSLSYPFLLIHMMTMRIISSHTVNLHYYMDISLQSMFLYRIIKQLMCTSVYLLSNHPSIIHFMFIFLVKYLHKDIKTLKRIG